MKSLTGRKIIDYTIIGVVVALFILMGLFASERRKTLRLTAINIEIKEAAKYDFVKRGDVLEAVEGIGVKPDAILCDSIDLAAVRATVGQNIYVKEARCRIGFLRGVLYVDIRQFNPMFRIIDDSGRGYFVDTEGCVVPKTGSRGYDIPVVTNHYAGFRVTPSKKSAEKGSDIEKLVTFVQHINEDKFLSPLVMQINITESGIVEIIPRAGGQIISVGRFARLDEAPGNMYKLKAFYTKGRGMGYLEKYKRIDISHSNQIICTE